MANPYRNTGKAGTSSPANLNIGGALGKAAKALLKKFTKSKPVSNFKPFHRDGVTYDTKSFNQVFENRFGPAKPKSPKPTDGWGMTGDEPLSKNPHWLGDADPRWNPATQDLVPEKAIKAENVLSTGMKAPVSTFDKMLPGAAGATGYLLAKNEEEVKKNKAKQKKQAARQGR